MSVAAPCVTEGITNCSTCEDCDYNYYYYYGDGYLSEHSCSCGSNCFTYGDCCSDISVLDNCFGKSSFYIM